MSRITGRSSVAPLNPWTNISTGVANQAWGMSPATSTPTTGTGIPDASFATYVGQKFDTSDGRELVMVANGTVALASGNLIQASAQITTAANLAIAISTAYPATAGLYQLQLTNTSTVMSAGQFNGGYAVVTAGTGIGQTYKINSHTPGTNAGLVTVTLEDPIQTTFVTASTTISLIANPYGGTSASAAGAVSNGVVYSPTTQSAGIVGVSLYPIAASTAPIYNTTSGVLATAGVIQYGLIVCHGPASCLVDTVTLVGNAVGHSTAVSGAVAAATLTASAQVGFLMNTAVSGAQGLIYLQL